VSQEPEIRRARMADLGRLVDYLNRVRPLATPINREALLRDWANWGYLLALDGDISGLAAWQVENYAACVREIIVADPTRKESLAKSLLATIEGEAGVLACRAIFLFAPKGDLPTTAFYQRLGYMPLEATLINKRWQEMVLPHLREGTALFIKEL